MQHGRSFLHGADNVAAGQMVAHMGYLGHAPFLAAVQLIHLQAAGNAVAGFGSDHIQRALNTVEDTFNQTGGQFHAHGAARRNYGFAGPEACRLFVNLNGGFIASKLDDFAGQILVRDADHVVHLHVGHAFGDNQRAGYFNYFSTHVPFTYPSLNKMSAPTAFSTFALTFFMPSPRVPLLEGMGMMAGNVAVA